MGYCKDARITVKYPEGMAEHEALGYVRDLFNEAKCDFRSLEPVGKKQYKVLTFGDNRTGYFYKDKHGFVLELCE